MVDQVQEVETFDIQSLRQQHLAGWVFNRVQLAQEDWKREWKARFDDYYRIWRGIWSQEMQNRSDERSKLIHPQLSAAIESTHAEVVSAAIHPETYFQLNDDDQEREDVNELQRKLHEDFKTAHMKEALIEVALIGTLWGTGIAKVEIGGHPRLVNVPGPDGELTLRRVTRPLVSLRPLQPHQYVIDPTAVRKSDAMFEATWEDVPRHLVLALQQSGDYIDNELGSRPFHRNSEDDIEGEEEPTSRTDDSVHRIEYYGLVPRGLLPGGDEEVTIDLEAQDEFGNDLPPTFEFDEDDLVEAIVVIGNKSVILREEENPLVNRDRLFVIYRHEKIPGQFWGRGVAEKGYNPHKALDANLRARQDALGLMVHPMFTVNQRMLPRGFKFSVSPGRNVPTTGDGAVAIQRIDMGGVTPDQFNNTGELAQMVQVATGAVDQQSQTTAGAQQGFNLQAINFVKRSQIAIANFSSELLVPLAELSTRLYMQFMPNRYPATDVSFKASAALGSLAKEMEQAQLLNLLKTMAGGPSALAILLSVVRNSSVEIKDFVSGIIENELQTALNPPPPQPTPLEQMQIQKLDSDIKAEQARRVTEALRVQAELMRAANDAVKADSDEAMKLTQSILNLANAQAAALSPLVELENQVTNIADAEAAENNAQLTNDTIRQAQNAGVEDLIRLVQGPGLGTPQ